MSGYKSGLLKLWIKVQSLFWSVLDYKKTDFLRPFFESKKGICIGGILHWKFLEYSLLAKEVVDVNLSESYLGKSVKVDLLTDANRLYFAKDEEFDFIASSHLLEHLTNPIMALHEWKRVVKPGGIIYCSVPDKRFTIDCRRKRTLLQHLIDDYENEVGLDDVTHIQEFIDNWEECMDVISKEQLIDNIKSNQAIYTHFHVWVKKDIVELFRFVGLEIVFACLRGHSVHIVGKKSL